MDLDSKGLGRMQRVADPREVWAMEAGDFTPWLAENLDVSADSTSTSRPRPRTGGRSSWRTSWLAPTTGTSASLLVYASGIEAAIVVWVAPDFSDEHRRALDRLNERTDTGVDFFGVEIGVVQIATTGPRVFWSTLKTEHYDRHNFPTRTAAIRAVSSWIENVYNRRRRHSALGQVTPVAFEHRLTTAVVQAA